MTFSGEQNYKEYRLTKVLVFLMIYFGFNTMLTANYIGPILSTILVLVFIFYKIIYNRFILKQTLSFNNLSVKVIMILIINVLITMIMNLDYSNGNYLLIIKMIIALLAATCFQFNLFKKAYIFSMKFVSIYSLIATYVLPKTFLANIVPIFYNESGIRFFNFGFSSVIDIPNYFRNFGIFTEPGMFVSYLIPALIFLITDNEELNKDKIFTLVIFTVTLFTTFSTTGIIAAMLLFISFIIMNNKVTLRKKFLIIVVFIAIFGVLFSNNYFNQSYQQSLDKIVNKESSYKGRTYSIAHNIEVWTSSPIYGKGLTNVTQVMNIDELRSVASSNTSTTTIFLAIYGIIFALIHLVSLYFTFRTNKTYFSFVIFGVYIFGINSQALFHSEFLWYLTFYGLQRITFINDEFLELK